MSLTKIDPRAISGNAFKLIGDDWMLITARKPDGSVNTMTASWGGMGVFWNRPTALCVIRPGRYTFEFVEQSDWLTLSFFDAQYREALNLLGTRSGRDGDKIAESGLVPRDFEHGAPGFEQARLTLVCHKMYWQVIDPSHFYHGYANCDGQFYPLKDYHTLYFSEIEAAYEGN